MQWDTWTVSCYDTLLSSVLCRHANVLFIYLFIYLILYLNICIYVITVNLIYISPFILCTMTVSLLSLVLCRHANLLLIYFYLRMYVTTHV